MALLLSRAQALKGVKSPRPALPPSPYHVKLEKKSLGVRRSGDKARASMQNLQIEDLKMKLFDEKAESRSSHQRGGDRADKDKSRSSRRGERHNRSRTSSHENDSYADASALDNAPALGDASHSSRPGTGARAAAQVSFTNEAISTPPQSSPQAPQSDCGLCSSSDFGLRDQLVPCTRCGQTYHTKCFGGKRIPFSIKSIKERTNRDRYVSKYFSDWVCPNCSEAKPSLSSGGASASSDSFPAFSSSANPQESSMSSGTSPGSAGRGGGGGERPAERSLSSKLFGNFLGYARSHSKGAISSSAAAEMEGQGGDTVNPLFVPSGKVGYKQAGSPNPPKATKTLDQSPARAPEKEEPADHPAASVDHKHEDFEKLISLLAACGVSVEELLSMSEEKQKETILAANSNLRSVGTSEPSTNDPSPPASMDPSPRSPPTVSNPAPASETPTEQPSSPQPSPAPSSVQVTLTAELLQQWAKVDQRFAKYAKMFQVGLPLKTIEERLKADGIDLSQVGPPPGAAEDSASPSPATGVSETKPATPEDPASVTPTPPSPVPATTTPETIPQQDQAIAEDDPRFRKYFQMMKVLPPPPFNPPLTLPQLGLPKLAVAHKMCTDGVVPSSDVAISILDHKLVTEKELLAPETKPTDSESTDQQPSAPQVPFIEHPEYGKFFRMLKAGIPAPAVKAKMTQEGFDPDLLDNKPTDLAPADLPKKSSAEAEQQEMVACKDHPAYSKYFKMLKVGLPLANVKAKMEQEGYDPAILDKAPTDLVPVEIKAEDPGPGEMVPLQDHPAYGKYLRMLKVGLPVVAAKQKMVDDGFDPTVLDKKLTDLVPLDTNYRAPEPKAAAIKRPAKSPAAKIRKKKLHWKALDKSRVGADSLWAADEDDEGFDLDAEEFEQLFVQKEQKGAAKPIVSEQKKKAVVLVDPKRAQNAGIALARVKLPFVEVRERFGLSSSRLVAHPPSPSPDRILEMDEKAFSADQYTSLMVGYPHLLLLPPYLPPLSRNTSPRQMRSRCSKATAGTRSSWALRRGTCWSWPSVAMRRSESNAFSSANSSARARRSSSMPSAAWKACATT
jgi:hypothetical protein